MKRTIIAVSMLLIAFGFVGLSQAQEPSIQANFMVNSGQWNYFHPNDQERMTELLRAFGKLRGEAQVIPDQTVEPIWPDTPWFDADRHTYSLAWYEYVALLIQDTTGIRLITFCLYEESVYWQGAIRENQRCVCDEGEECSWEDLPTAARD